MTLNGVMAVILYYFTEFGSIRGPLRRRHALHQLRYQLHSVEGRAKCPTVLNVVNS